MKRSMKAKAVQRWKGVPERFFSELLATLIWTDPHFMSSPPSGHMEKSVYGCISLRYCVVTSKFGSGHNLIF